jgi:formate/nitrite transporter FocA (FNT family)
MRYIVAIIFAVIGAVLAMLFLGEAVAAWAALQFKFESSDAAENVNQLAFLGVMLGGVICGWTIGWAIAGPLQGSQRPS